MKSPLLPMAVMVGLLLAGKLFASPWIDTDDVYLRHDLQALADAGLLKAPLNTFPIMWSSIDKDLDKLQASHVPERLRFAYLRVNHALRQARGNDYNKRTKVGYASDNPVNYGFGDKPRADGLWLEGSIDHVGSRFAGRLNVARASGHAPVDESDIRFDGSYLSYIVGNWAITGGWQNRWWGPGNDSTLLLSNNARPLPAVSLSRVSTEAFKTPWLSWIGEWNFTTFVGRFEDDRHIDNALLWGMRANFKPLDSLEIGLARTIQLGGDGRSSSIDTFVDAFVGKDNPEGEAGLRGEEPGNQLAGVDIRYSFNLFDQSLATYAEWIGEDEEGGRPNKAMKMMGGEWLFGSTEQQSKIFLEFSDTEVRCFPRQSGNCAYEHDIYFSGYRHYLRSLGSTYDSDTRALVLGMTREYDNGHAWRLSLKRLEINRDGSQPPASRPGSGTPFGNVAIDTEALTGHYRMPLQGGMLTIGGEVFSEKVSVIGTPENANVFATWEVRY